MTIKNSLFGFNSNGLLNHGKEGKTRYYVIQCRFSEFLIQMCIKNAFIAVPCRNITTMRRNIAFFGVRAEILLSRNQGRLDSRAGPFLGYVQIYSFLEKYSPLKASTSISIEDISNRRNTSENVRENTKENTREDNRENAREDTRQNIRENTKHH